MTVKTADLEKIVARMGELFKEFALKVWPLEASLDVISTNYSLISIFPTEQQMKPSNSSRRLLQCMQEIEK